MTKLKYANLDNFKNAKLSALLKVKKFAKDHEFIS